MTVTVPYELREGENHNSVKVYYVDDDGNLTQMVTKYDPATGTVSFETNHFSYYMIGIGQHITLRVCSDRHRCGPGHGRVHR